MGKTSCSVNQPVPRRLGNVSKVPKLLILEEVRPGRLECREFDFLYSDGERTFACYAFPEMQSSYIVSREGRWLTAGSRIVCLGLYSDVATMTMDVRDERWTWKEKCPSEKSLGCFVRRTDYMPRWNVWAVEVGNRMVRVVDVGFTGANVAFAEAYDVDSDRWSSLPMLRLKIVKRSCINYVFQWRGNLFVFYDRWTRASYFDFEAGLWVGGDVGKQMKELLDSMRQLSSTLRYAADFTATTQFVAAKDGALFAVLHEEDKIHAFVLIQERSVWLPAPLPADRYKSGYHAPVTWAVSDTYVFILAPLKGREWYDYWILDKDRGLVKSNRVIGKGGWQPRFAMIDN